MTDTSRRSATGTAGVDRAVRDATMEGVAAAASGVAHSEQNFEAGVLTVPQVGQGAANRVAHSLQNFALAGFSVPQFGQIKLLPRRLRGGA